MPASIIGIYHSFNNSDFGKFVDGLTTPNGMPGQILLDNLLKNAGLTMDVGQASRIRRTFDAVQHTVMNSANRYVTVTFTVTYTIPGRKKIIGREPDTQGQSEFTFQMFESEEQRFRPKENIDLALHVIYISCKDDIRDRMLKAGFVLNKFITYGGTPGLNQAVPFNLEAWRQEYVAKPPAPKPLKWRLLTTLAMALVVGVGYLLSIYFVITAGITVAVTVWLGKKWWIGALVGGGITALAYFLKKGG